MFYVNKPIFLSPIFQSSRLQVDIVVSMDGVHMLVNIIIIKPIRADLVFWIVFSILWGFSYNYNSN
jgi:hypothetical protein